MRKMLKTQDILLLGLSGVLDLFEEIRDPLQLLSKGYENMYGWTPKRYKRHNFYHLVWRNLKTGNIEKIEKNGEVYLRLTSRGDQKLKRDFPLISMQQKPWDKKWRIAIFDIREEYKNRRDALRGKLREIGFAMLQESVFITPHDIVQDFNEFVENFGLSDAVYILEVSQIVVGDKKELARNLWNLDKLNDTYKEIIEKLKNISLTTTRGRVKQLNRESFTKTFMELKQKYLKTLIYDPFLPKELLPSDWKGDEVKKLIKKLRHIHE